MDTGRKCTPTMWWLTINYTRNIPARLKRLRHYELKKYKFKYDETKRIYYRDHYPKLFGIIPLIFSDRKKTVIISADKRIHIHESYHTRLADKYNDKEIKDLLEAGLI